MKITNNLNIPYEMLIWLLDNNYNNKPENTLSHINPDHEIISATTLLKSTRSLILSRRAEQSGSIEMDISSLIASRIGQTLHEGIESSINKKGSVEAPMRLLEDGSKYDPRNQCNKDGNIIVCNGTDELPKEAKRNDFIIYQELRRYKTISDITLTGQMDMISNGQLIDFKNTSVFSYNDKNKEQNYILQGSIYKWLAPDLIKSNTVRIYFIFNDWQQGRSFNSNYPKCRITYKDFKLLTVRETEQWIINKLKEIRDNAKKSNDNIIRCTTEELWMGDPVYKYFTKESNKRASKTFKTETEAVQYLQDKGKGIIKTVFGTPKACHYCNAWNICNQRKELFEDV